MIRIRLKKKSESQSSLKERKQTNMIHPQNIKKFHKTSKDAHFFGKPVPNLNRNE